MIQNEGNSDRHHKISRNREKAKHFFDFLKIEEAHMVFQKWGWK